MDGGLDMPLVFIDQNGNQVIPRTIVCGPGVDLVYEGDGVYELVGGREVCGVMDTES